MTVHRAVLSTLDISPTNTLATQALAVRGQLAADGVVARHKSAELPRGQSGRRRTTGAAVTAVRRASYGGLPLSRRKSGHGGHGVVMEQQHGENARTSFRCLSCRFTSRHRPVMETHAKDCLRRHKNKEQEHHLDKVRTRSMYAECSFSSMDCADDYNIFNASVL